MSLVKISEEKKKKISENVNLYAQNSIIAWGNKCNLLHNLITYTIIVSGKYSEKGIK
jgi:hypothetical protein